MKVSALTIYPVKSMAGISVESSELLAAGLKHDRRFMVVKPDGSFVTGRTHHELVRIFPTFDGETLSLRHEEHGEVRVSVSALNDEYLHSEVWRTEVKGQICGEEIDEWISKVVNDTVRLVYFGPQSQRLVDGEAGTEVGFADGYPVLVATDAGLDDLNARMEPDVTMANFRPNIVIGDTEPFAEDGWRKIRLGAVEVELVKPCARCIFTTVNPETGKRETGPYPLKALAEYRKHEKGIMFGQNGMTRVEGTLSVGDPVEILQTQEKITFQS